MLRPLRGKSKIQNPKSKIEMTRMTQEGLTHKIIIDAMLAQQKNTLPK